MDVTGIFIFPPLRQYYVIFCCFKDFSTPQGVICKLSFFKFIITDKIYFITPAKYSN